MAIKKRNAIVGIYKAQALYTTVLYISPNILNLDDIKA